MKIVSTGWFSPAYRKGTFNPNCLVRQFTIEGKWNIHYVAAVIGPEWRTMGSRERSRVKRQRIREAKKALIEFYMLQRLLGKA